LILLFREAPRPTQSALIFWLGRPLLDLSSHRKPPNGTTKNNSNMIFGSGELGNMRDRTRHKNIPNNSAYINARPMLLSQELSLPFNSDPEEVKTLFPSEFLLENQ
jgi:hypothetical protein